MGRKTKARKTLKESIYTAGLGRMVRYIDKDPEKNIPKVLSWIEKTGRVQDQVKACRDGFEKKDSNWYKLIMSFWNEIDDDERRTLFENFIVNSNILGGERRDKTREKEGCSVPWAILMDPTSACNLHCTGCWAADYGNKLNMTLEELDDIITQGEKMGIFMYIYSGGEPLVRKKDIIKLCELHPDCEFLAFTNATLIDEAFANEMLRVRNFVPAISVEGFEEQTDFRRGEGTYQKAVKAMEILKRKKLAFGISCCYTSKNIETIGSEAYFDKMIELGAKFAWFFTYIPIGKDAVAELMATPEQREFMFHQIRMFRETKPLFTMDFWNDGQYVDGCIAGGKDYLHINANGDIEPCAFIHYSDSNIREKTLLEAFKSPLFMAYHNNQPFNENLLRPCPLLDNPEKLKMMVEQTGAKSTDMQSPEDVNDLTAKTRRAAEKWAPVADKLWDTCVRGEGPCASCMTPCGVANNK